MIYCRNSLRHVYTWRSTSAPQGPAIPDLVQGAEAGHYGWSIGERSIGVRGRPQYEPALRARPTSHATA